LKNKKQQLFLVKSLTKAPPNPEYEPMRDREG